MSLEAIAVKVPVRLTKHFNKVVAILQGKEAPTTNHLLDNSRPVHVKDHVYERSTSSSWSWSYYFYRFIILYNKLFAENKII